MDVTRIIHLSSNVKSMWGVEGRDQKLEMNQQEKRAPEKA